MGGGGSRDGAPMRVAFAGLPSAGKSTMINALAGARLLETGVCRTTRKPCVLSPEDFISDVAGLECDWKQAEICSDDGVDMYVVDLPGVCDSENAAASATESDFTKLTMQWAKQCDVIAWVTDVRTCFLTSHEKADYEKLKSTLEMEAENTGKLFQFCIVLTKCDVGLDSPQAPTAPTAPKKLVKGEIVSESEDTTVADCIERVRRLFPTERIVPFNAFGKILARTGRFYASDALLALAMRLAPGTPKVNCEFNLQWATADLPRKRQRQLVRSILLSLKNGHSTRQRVESLDEHSTGLILCFVLGVAPSALEAELAFIELTLGPFLDLDSKRKFAARIGVMQHAAGAAKVHEADITSRFRDIGTKIGTRAIENEFVSAMIAMCGPSCLVTTRMYLRACMHVSVPVPRNMSVVPDGYPALLNLDVQYAKNKVLIASVSWVQKVRVVRVLLWGDDESDVCVQTTIALAGSGVLASVLSPVCFSRTVESQTDE